MSFFSLLKLCYVQFYAFFIFSIVPQPFQRIFFFVFAGL